VQNAPFVLIIENNRYAYSTPAYKSSRCEKLADRAIGYGIPGVQVDGNDALEVYRIVKAAVERAREGHGPSLIECLTMRMAGHSAHDDAAYMDQQQLAEYELKDPIHLLERRLLEEKIIDPSQLARLHEHISAEIESAAETALVAPLPDPAGVSDGVYA